MRILTQFHYCKIKCFIYFFYLLSGSQNLFNFISFYLLFLFTRAPKSLLHLYFFIYFCDFCDFLLFFLNFIHWFLKKMSFSWYFDHFHWLLWICHFYWLFVFYLLSGSQNLFNLISFYLLFLFTEASKFLLHPPKSN